MGGVTTLNELAKQVHRNAVKHGWWRPARRLPEILMLCVSELAEALEEYRDGHDVREVYYRKEKPEGVPIELADCIIRILDFCAYAGIDIEEAIRTKVKYNRTRPYRHGGKKA